MNYMGREHIHIYTRKQTLRLLDRIGPLADLVKKHKQHKFNLKSLNERKIQAKLIIWQDLLALHYNEPLCCVIWCSLNQHTGLIQSMSRNVRLLLKKFTTQKIGKF